MEKQQGLWTTFPSTNNTRTVGDTIRLLYIQTTAARATFLKQIWSILRAPLNVEYGSCWEQPSMQEGQGRMLLREARTVRMRVRPGRRRPDNIGRGCR